MQASQPSDRAALGRARLAERARRVGRIRRAVVAATLSAFVLAWGVIVYDGSMGTTSAAGTTTPAATSTPDTSSSDDSSSSDSAAPLTTSQS
jgi:hypothetical protein